MQLPGLLNHSHSVLQKKQTFASQNHRSLDANEAVKRRLNWTSPAVSAARHTLSRVITAVATATATAPTPVYATLQDTETDVIVILILIIHYSSNSGKNFRRRSVSEFKAGRLVCPLKCVQNTKKRKLRKRNVSRYSRILRHGPCTRFLNTMLCLS